MLVGGGDHDPFARDQPAAARLGLELVGGQRVEPDRVGLARSARRRGRPPGAAAATSIPPANHGGLERQARVDPAVDLAHVGQPAALSASIGAQAAASPSTAAANAAARRQVAPDGVEQRCAPGAGRRGGARAASARARREATRPSSNRRTSPQTVSTSSPRASRAPAELAQAAAREVDGGDPVPARGEIAARPARCRSRARAPGLRRRHGELAPRARGRPRRRRTRRRARSPPARPAPALIARTPAPGRASASSVRSSISAV